MAVRIRKSVYSLAIVETALDWYALAVGAMKNRAVDDPTSWWYMASVHGDPGLTRPPNAGTYWDQCQHQTWYFLPWHRGYVAAFEAMIAKEVAALGGPADWSLPYWDYSESLTTNPDARKIPVEFQHQFYSDGSENPLWAPRNMAADGTVGLSDNDVDLGALASPFFTDSTGFSPGFGGPATGFSHFGSASGDLESIPHNVVHVRIGGWMQDPNTAAFDPIFWLHHCNIDRLWDEWLVNDGFHFNPFEDAWRTDLAFHMHDGDGNEITFTPADTEDTTTFMHGYMYDSIPVPPFGVPFFGHTEGAPVLAELNPELAGTTESAVRLDGALTSAPVKLATDGMSQSFTESGLPTPLKVFLRLENVRGTGLPSDYDVMIDIDGDTEDPLRVGTLSTFAIANASDPDSAHGGNGITQVYEITYAVERLKLTEADTQELQVSFREIDPGPQVEAGLLAIPGVTRPDQEESSVEVGRIAIYFE